jgi:hypothetical protein
LAAAALSEAAVDLAQCCATISRRQNASTSRL